MPRFFSILLLAGALFCSVAQSVYSLERMAQRDTVVEEAQTGPCLLYTSDAADD